MCQIKRLVAVSLASVAFAWPLGRPVSAEQEIEAVATEELQLYSRPPTRLWPFPFVRPAAPADDEVVATNERFTRHGYREIYLYPERTLWWQIEMTDGSEGWIYLGPVGSGENAPGDRIRVIEAAEDGAGRD